MRGHRHDPRRLPRAPARDPVRNADTEDPQAARRHPLPRVADGAPGGRVDRAVTCAASETHALGASTRKAGLALERMGAAEADALAHLDFPEAHGRRMRADNVQERRDREIRRRTRVVRSLPSEAALARLVGAVLCEADDDWSGGRHIAPASVAEPWEPSRVASTPSPDPDEAEVGRQGKGCPPSPGLTPWGGRPRFASSKVQGRGPLHHFSRRYQIDTSSNLHTDEKSPDFAMKTGLDVSSRVPKVTSAAYDRSVYLSERDGRRCPCSPPCRGGQWRLRAYTTCSPPPSHSPVANQSSKKMSHSMAHGTYVSAMSCPLSQSRLWRQSFTLFDFPSNSNRWGIEPRSSHRSSAPDLAQTSGNRPLLQVSQSSYVSHPSVGASMAFQVSFPLLCVTLEFGKRCFKAKSCCPMLSDLLACLIGRRTCGWGLPSRHAAQEG